MKIFNNMSKQRKTKPDADETVDNKTTVEVTNDAEVNNPTIDNAELTDATGVGSEDIIAGLNKKIEDLNDKFLRLYSEFDNYRKRVIKEKIDLSKNASEELIISLLPIMDDFERAISTFETVETVEPLKEGTLLIYNKLKNNLTQKGLQETDALGLPFDTDFHEAIANAPSPSEDLKNKIIDVTQKGYALNGKVIRFAKVVVGA